MRRKGGVGARGKGESGVKQGKAYFVIRLDIKLDFFAR